MKVMFLSMTCGECHNAMARSLLASLKEGDEGKIVDIYGTDEHSVHDTERGYLFCTRHLPRIYEAIWNHSRRRDPMKRYRGLAMSGIAKGADYVERQIEEYKPDAVVCTHSQASNIVCWLKIHNRFHGKVYVVMHDYINCPYWEGSVFCDAVFMPHPVANRFLLERGFREEQLIPTGFPVHPKFLGIDRGEARRKLGIDPDAFTVLIVSGGAGIGNTKALLLSCMRAVKSGEKVTVVAVCGRNIKERKRLEKLALKDKKADVRVFGFIDNMNEFLRASDLYFCRGGMGSISEGLACGANIVVRERPMAQEHRNRDILKKFGACDGIAKDRYAGKLLRAYLDDRGKGEAMKKSAAEFFIQGGAENILEYVRADIGSVK